MGAGACRLAGQGVDRLFLVVVVGGGQGGSCRLVWMHAFAAGIGPVGGFTYQPGCVALGPALAPCPADAAFNSPISDQELEEASVAAAAGMVRSASQTTVPAHSRHTSASVAPVAVGGAQALGGSSSEGEVGSAEASAAAAVAAGLPVTASAAQRVLSHCRSQSAGVMAAAAAGEPAGAAAPGMAAAGGSGAPAAAAGAGAAGKSGGDGVEEALEQQQSQLEEELMAMVLDLGECRLGVWGEGGAGVGGRGLSGCLMGGAGCMAVQGRRWPCRRVGEAAMHDTGLGDTSRWVGSSPLSIVEFRVIVEF